MSSILKPGKAMRELLKARHPGRRAVPLLVGVVVLYIVTSAVLGSTGAVPTAPVLSGMDVGNYYFWQMLFVLPLIIAVWILTSGLIRADGKSGQAGGTPGASLALASVALSSPLLLAWMPSAVEAVFMVLGMGQGEWVGLLSKPGPWQTAYLVIYAVAAALALRNFILAARLLRKKPGRSAVLAGVAAAIVATCTYLVLIR